ncbi:MAG: hypothetical protein LBP59_17460 [Planctomycetaceae bacterium]|nr:hypothetical protein [Planctomycetaceae bacterium]
MLFIQIVLEFQRFKSVKACRLIVRQAKVNVNSSMNGLIIPLHCHSTTPT